MTASSSRSATTQPILAAYELPDPRGDFDQTQVGRWSTLSKVQIALLAMIGGVVIAVQVLIINTYLSADNTSTDFSEATILTTGLANIQRESLMLQLETGNLLVQPGADTRPLEIRRALLSNQLRLQLNQSTNNPAVTDGLNAIKQTLSEFDEMLTLALDSPMSSRNESMPELEAKLSELELQIKTLYDAEELSFFGAFKSTLDSQRTSQIMLIIVDVLGLALGTVLLLSIFRSVRALRDEMSKRALVEVELHLANESLEMRIQERTAELTTSNETLESEIVEREQAQKDLKEFAAKLELSNQELQDFASVAAHDLQEPLRKVQTFGDRLKTKFGDNLGEQGLDYLERMQQASARMTTLINDLLTYSRVTTKGQPFVPVDLSETTREVISDLEIRIESAGGIVELEELPTIDADALQMRQLMQNIIGNGLKYHRPDVPPIVKISVQPSPSDDMCKIVVEDNGIGFDDKYVDRIFTIFQRLHSRSEYEGTGVGLAVVRKIVERHGGTITATSTPDVGSSFVVLLPLHHEYDFQEASNAAVEYE